MNPIPCKVCLRIGNAKIIDAVIVSFLMQGLDGDYNDSASAIVVLKNFDIVAVHCLPLEQIRIDPEWSPLQ